VKNFMADTLLGVRVPVMLGVWGPKGCGKTFMTELAFKKLGCAPSCIHAPSERPVRLEVSMQQEQKQQHVPSADAVQPATMLFVNTQQPCAQDQVLQQLGMSILSRPPCLAAGWSPSS
jgi:predicted ATPase